MPNDMVAIQASKLPAHLQGKIKTNNVFGAAVSASGFPVISIKGKVFHIQRGDEKTLVSKEGVDDEPAGSLEAVIVAVTPTSLRFTTQLVTKKVVLPSLHVTQTLVLSQPLTLKSRSLRSALHAPTPNGVLRSLKTAARVKHVETLCA